jgi:hypothetical protein
VGHPTRGHTRQHRVLLMVVPSDAHVHVAPATPSIVYENPSLGLKWDSFVDKSDEELTPMEKNESFEQLEMLVKDNNTLEKVPVRGRWASFFHSRNTCMFMVSMQE